MQRVAGWLGVLSAGLVLGCGGGGNSAASSTPPAPVVDAMPDAFTIPRIQTTLAAGSTVLSEPVLVKGFTGPLAIEILNGGRVGLEGGTFAERMMVNPGDRLRFEGRVPDPGSVAAHSVSLGQFYTRFEIEAVRKPLVLPGCRLEVDTQTFAGSGVRVRFLWDDTAPAPQVASYTVGFDSNQRPSTDPAAWVWEASTTGRLPTGINLGFNQVEPWTGIEGYQKLSLATKVPIALGIRDSEGKEGRMAPMDVEVRFQNSFACTIANTGFLSGYDHLNTHIRLVLGETPPQKAYTNNPGTTITFTELAGATLDDVDWSATEVQGFEETPDIRVVPGDRKVTLVPQAGDGKITQGKGIVSIVLKLKDGRTFLRQLTFYYGWKGVGLLG